MTQRRRIAFLNRCYWPDVEATGQLLQQLCESLADKWDVTVVCGQPNSNPSGDSFLPRGKQIHHGVTVDRLPHTTFNKRSKTGRLTNLLSFTRQVKAWGRRQQGQIPFDVIVSETDPFFLPIVAASIAQQMNAKFVAYTQDIYPDIAVGLGVIREGILTRQIRRRLLSAYGRADCIVTLDSDMRDRLTDWGLPAAKMKIVPNWIDTDAIQPVKTNNPFRIQHNLDDCFVVMHSGNMGMSQQLETLIDATRDPVWPSQAMLALVGDGARRTWLQQYAAASNATQVRFFDYQPKARLGESLSAADLHVISMDPNIRGCLAPSKLYGILASGTPVIAVAPSEFAIARTIIEAGVGKSIAPKSPQQIAVYVRWCIENPQEMQKMQNESRRLAESNYDAKICCQQFADVLDSLP